MTKSQDQFHGLFSQNAESPKCLTNDHHTGLSFNLGKVSFGLLVDLRRNSCSNDLALSLALHCSVLLSLAVAMMFAVWIRDPCPLSCGLYSDC